MSNSTEIISIDGINHLCKVIEMAKDGACMFHAIAYHIYGTSTKDKEARQMIVDYVVGHWDRFEMFSFDVRTGGNYITAEEYKKHMSIKQTFGTTVELQAAAEVFDICFKVFQNLELLYTIGSTQSQSKLLRFSGDLNSGHFDVYDILHSDSFANTNNLSSASVVKPCSVVLHKLDESIISNYLKNQIIDDVVLHTKSRGRPTKTAIGKTPYIIDKGISHLKSVRKYNKNNPQVNRSSVKKYSANNRELKRKSQKKYESNNKLIITEQRQQNVISTVYNKYDESVVSYENNILMGTFNGSLLNTIQPLRLKKSLKSSDTYKCVHCGAFLFDEEKSRKMWCCGQNRYNVHVLPLLNAEFYNDDKFLKLARSYNNLFSFSALGTSHGFNRPADGNGPYLVKVQGRIYHRIFDLSYTGSTNNTALYIHDGLEHKRIGTENLKLNEVTIDNIYTYLQTNNPLIQKLNILSSHPSSFARLVFENTSRSTHGPILGDRPTSDEISALIKFSPDASPREVAIWKIGESKPHYVPILHPAYESLQYPLLFPTAPERWSVQLKDKKGNKLSQVKYYRCQILSDVRFAKLRRLSQEYYVDMWCRTEEERLQFYKHNQQNFIRTATRKEIDETIVGEGNIPGKIYLPASFTHGPRYMQIKYHDAMAIVTRLGKPSMFLTVTCNPRWPEIIESLLPGQQASDRPDLCVRVFQLRLNKLLQLINTGKIFGTIISIMHVIEFQKRGLPHAHIAFRVGGGGPVDSIEIDKFIHAIIPPVEESKLRKLVLQHMIHGPCSYKSPCFDTKTKKCSKKFPKSHVDTTHTDEKGFVHYKRPASDPPAIIGERTPIIVTNEWIVPYNPAIILLMECHCNLEIASTVKVIKYLYKYITKGPDFAKVGVTENSANDEIESYVQYRYVSASDALWRLYEFDICSRHPNVVALPIHLPNQDTIIFREGNEQEARDRTISKLMLYMTRPSNTELDACTYIDFYEKFNVDTKPRERATVEVLQHESGRYFITRRIKGDCVARIHFVSPTLGELFYLRMLLTRFPCRSYEELRTVDGSLYDTFQRAAFARGILENNEEFEIAMSEAAAFKTGSGFRQLYFALIMDGAPALLLWEKFRDYLSEDFHKGVESAKETAYNKGLREIENMLRAHGRTLQDLGLPETRDSPTEYEKETTRWVNDAKDTLGTWESKLNQDQQFIYETILAIIQKKGNDNTQTNFSALFIDGPAGTGKTVLLNVLASKLRANGDIVLCTGTTGIAALNHIGGVTAHSLFKLPLEFHGGGNDIWGISNNTQRAELIRRSQLIIIDEAPMAHKHLLEAIDKGLRDLMRCNSVFGGKTIVLAGDFRQIPPVIPGGGQQDIINASIKSSSFWKDVKIFHLHINQRATCDPDFCSFLLEVGENRVRKIGDLISLQNLKHFISLDDLISFTYPENDLKQPQIICNRAILSGTNENIKEINDIILQRIPGDEFTCYSADSAVASNPEILDCSFLNTVTCPGVPDHNLKLKIGAVVILIRNLSFTHRLVNGTKLIIDKATKFCIYAHHPNKQDQVLIPRINFKFTIGRNGVEMLRRQFPLKLAYGMTINKSQGQTLDRVGVDLRSDIFSHGQLYVALGRVKSSKSIRVLVSPDRVKGNAAYTKNLVYETLINHP